MRTGKRNLVRRVQSLSVLLGLAGTAVGLWQVTHRQERHIATTPLVASASADTASADTTSAATAPVARTPIAGTDPASTQSCTNDADGYTVQYPAGWVTEGATAAQACHFFGAKPFTVTASDNAAGDVFIDTSTPGSYDAFVAQLDQPGDASITVQHEATVVNGHRASTMNMTMHAGNETRFAYGYVVEHNGSPLVLTTGGLGAPSPEMQQVVTEMVQRLVWK